MLVIKLAKSTIRWTLALLTITSFSLLNGQSVERSCVATSGGSFKNSDLSLDWTLGEPVIETVNNAEMILSQGFHQSSSDMPEFYYVSGKVFAGNDLLDNGRVEMYLSDIDEKFEPAYSAPISQGEFNLSFIPVSSFYLLATPDNNPYFLPTYFLRSVDRENATELMNDANIGGIELHLLPYVTDIKPVDNEVSSKIEVYPNPFINIVRVKPNKTIQNAQIWIYGITGEVVFHNRHSNITDLSLNLNYLESGIYMMKIKSESCNYMVRLIKE